MVRRGGVLGASSSILVSARFVEPILREGQRSHVQCVGDSRNTSRSRLTVFQGFQVAALLLRSLASVPENTPCRESRLYVGITEEIQQQNSSCCEKRDAVELHV